jgi:hypothetical protein
MDEVKFFNRAITVAEIQAIYLAGANASEKKLVVTG